MKRILLVFLVAAMLLNCSVAENILTVSPDEAARQIVGVWSFWSGGEIMGDAVEFCADGTGWSLVPQNYDVYPPMDPQRTDESWEFSWHIEEGNTDDRYWENLLVIDTTQEKYGIALLENGCMHIAYGEGGGTYARNYEQKLRMELEAKSEEEKSEFDWLLAAYLDGSFTESCVEHTGLNVQELALKRNNEQWQFTVDTTTGLFELEEKEIRYYADEEANLWRNDGEPEAMWNVPPRYGKAARPSANYYAIMRTSVEWNWTGPAPAAQQKEEEYQQQEESYQAPEESYQQPEEINQQPEEILQQPEKTEWLPGEKQKPDDFERAPAELTGVTEKWKNGKVYPVYYGPVKAYGRGAKGKASVSTNDVLTVYGRFKGSLLVSYEVSKSKMRFGWILPADLSSQTINKYDELEFCRDTDNIEYFYGVLKQAADLTDDPIRGHEAIAHMPAGNSVHVLAGYGDWYYVEGFVNGKLAMGFVPRTLVDREHGYVQDAKLTIDKTASFSKEDILAAMETAKAEIYENWYGMRLLELKYIESRSANPDRWWQDEDGILLGMELYADLNAIELYDFEIADDVADDYSITLYREENGSWWIGNWGYK